MYWEYLSDEKWMEEILKFSEKYSVVVLDIDKEIMKNNYWMEIEVEEICVQ